MAVVLVAGKIHQAGIALLQSRPEIETILVDPVTAEAYRPHLAQADAVLIRTQPLTAADIAAAPRLRIVSRHGVGYDAVDVQALTARRIPLAIVGDVNSRAVAEHTLMLMLAAARRTVAHHLAATQGNWNERNRFDAVELDGKTLLVLGFGRIGRRVAELAQAFGMKIMAYDPYVAEDGFTTRGIVRVQSIAEALPLADVITVHLPGGTGPAIGQSELHIMKAGSIIVNAARGGIIDEQALDQALRDRSIHAAALDVLSEEPPASDHPLINNPFVTISPHNAGLTEECAMRMSLAAAQNIIDCFDGRLSSNLVANADALERAT